MKAIVVTEQAVGTAGMKLVERPEPQAAINDVVVRVHASGFVPTELTWPSTWTDRLDRDRTPSIPGHELAGVVTALGYGTTGLSVGQRVFGLADWYRDGTLAEYVAMEARNLAPLPGDVDFTVGASPPISGLTAWQGLFQHGRLQAGQSVLVHGAAGAVGSTVTQLARVRRPRHRRRTRRRPSGGARLRRAGLRRPRQRRPGRRRQSRSGVRWHRRRRRQAVRSPDLSRRNAGVHHRAGRGTAADGLAVDFVVESDRAQLSEIVQRVRDGRLRTNIDNVSTLDDAVAALNPTARRKGKTIIRVRP